jgi:hypothetical protein
MKKRNHTVLHGQEKKEREVSSKEKKFFLMTVGLIIFK